jgi:hypothetical protein
MESVWLDFLSKQLPVVFILGVFCIAMYKYLTGEIKKKDTMIEVKDSQILEQNKQVMILYGQAIDSQNKSIAVKEKMLLVIDRLENDKEKSLIVLDRIERYMEKLSDK